MFVITELILKVIDITESIILIFFTYTYIEQNISPMNMFHKSIHFANHSIFVWAVLLPEKKRKILCIEADYQLSPMSNYWY